MSVGARLASARIAAKSAVKIRAALAGSIDGRRVYTQYMDTQPPITANNAQDRARARAWAMKNVKLDLEAYKKALRTHYAVMYVLGQREALENMATAAKAQKGPVATANSKPKTNAQGMPIFDPSFTINWDAWTPGNEAAAALLDEPGGLKDLLGNIDIQARGIADYSHDLLGRALADGIARGDTPVTIANDIRDSLSAPERALTIAITEGQRAKISANLDSYQANGVEQIEWTVNDPDDADCLDNDGEIVNMGDQFPSGDTQPPVHPNCQCDVIPVMPDLSGTPEYSDQPVDEGDDSEMAVRADLEKYSETQERDSHGRFGSGSGESSTAESAGKEALDRAGSGKTLEGYDHYLESSEFYRTYENDRAKMGEVIHAQGFDKPSIVLPLEEFDKLAKSGNFVTVYRGGPEGLTEGLTSGNPWIGDGNAGPGTYVTTNVDRAGSYANQAEKGETVTMLIPSELITNAPDRNDSNYHLSPTPAPFNRQSRGDTLEMAVKGVGAYNSAYESKAGDYVVFNTSALIIRGQ